ncbi:MAG: hypothetical protein ACRD4F_08345 [Candidatus Angelobacter sp.]
MATAVRVLLLVAIFAFPGTSLTAQTGTDESIFTIAVAAPTAAKDVQVRYFLADEAGARWSSTAATTKNDKIFIHADIAGRTPKAFSAIAYAPGCQFVTFTAEDLKSSTRQGDFQCLKLPILELRGTVPNSHGRQQLDVESMYVVRWAGKFFGVPGVSISPLALAKTAVQADGTFAMELPDFTADPLWNSFSSDATLMFFLVDHATGHRVSGLKAPPALAENGNLKIAASYPEVTFSVRPNRTKHSSARNE